MRAGLAQVQNANLTLARLFALYTRHETPKKSAWQREADARKVRLWARWLGGTKDPHHIMRREWEGFISARGTGAVGGNGNAVPAKDRKPVGTRVVEIDLVWLKAVLNWAISWAEQPGHRVLRENPVRGFTIPREENPRRPVASDDRYEATRAISDQITMRIRAGGKQLVQRSYLSEILDIANGTARRISAICQLRYEDLQLTSTPSAPHGAIRWPGTTDKEGRAWAPPITPPVRAALERVLRERPGIGAAYLFPPPVDPTCPIEYGLASEWLRRAERLAGLPKLKGGVWHPYRRRWATVRKHLPLTDVAAAGGWKSTQTLLKCYQQPDKATMLEVVLAGAELRERGRA